MHSLSTTPDPVPPRRVCDDHEAALALGPRLVARLSELRRHARGLTGSAAEAEDLVQETCSRALEAAGRFRPGTDLGAWLRCIMRNIQCDHARRSWRDVALADDGERLPAPHRGACPLWRQVSDEDVAQAVEALPTPFRTAFVRHEIDRRSYQEISRELQIPSSTVGTRLVRARSAIRRYLVDRYLPDWQVAYAADFGQPA